MKVDGLDKVHFSNDCLIAATKANEYFVQARASLLYCKCYLLIGHSSQKSLYKFSMIAIYNSSVVQTGKLLIV